MCTGAWPSDLQMASAKNFHDSEFWSNRNKEIFMPVLPAIKFSAVH